MKILAIDTSSNICSVAILEDETIIDEINLNNGKTHSENLMPIINEILNKNSVLLQEINLISCCVGPGSFTGIRIGVASMKAIAEVQNIPIASVTSLETLARIDDSNKIKVSLIDARNNQVYCGLFDSNHTLIGNYMADDINRKIIAERQSEQAKSDLITNVSHDLRTPLTSIMGYIGLVKEGKYDDEDEMKEYLNIAFSKAEKLKVLINDLFEYTKLSSEGIKINKVRVNLIEFLSQLSEELMPLFEQNNLELVSYYGKEEGIQVDIDPDKMVRVFDNLFTNAIKYSYKPGVISVDVVKDQGYVTVVIRNRGENIPKEKIEKLFDRFYRVEESRNTQTGGTGLGLAISKNIVELHGGNIWAECFGAEISFFIKLRGI